MRPRIGKKDVIHAKALIRAGVNIERVEKQLELLQDKRILGAKEALEFLDDVIDQ